MPSRITTIPPTVSPSPCHSATPSRMSGPNVTVPKSRTSTGVPFLVATGTVSEIAQRMQIAEAANHVFRPAHFKQASADFVRAGANFFDDRRERNSVGAKFVGIELT